MSILDTAARQSWPPIDRDCLLDTPDARVRLAALTTIAAILVHELSQPIAAATNYIHSCAGQLRNQQGDAEDLLPMIEHAARETVKAGEIIRRMRSFIISGKLSGRRESLAAMIDTVGPALECPDGVNAEIVTSIQQNSEHVIVDRVQIEQVLSAILANAREALVGCTVRRITISAARFGDNVVMRIQDSGPGLSDYQYIHLFEPLLTTKTAGTGLGMPICKTIVEAHGGRLWAERPNGGGAMFGLSLPAAD